MVPAPSNTDLHAENVSVVDFCHKERKDVNICLDFLKKSRLQILLCSTRKLNPEFFFDRVDH